MLIFLPGCVPVRCIPGVYNTILPKTLFSSGSPILHETPKNIHAGVPTGNFRHFDPKNHCFYPCSFLHRWTFVYQSICVNNISFHKNIIFFRVHLIHEVTQNIYMCAYICIFRQVDPKNHCFDLRSFFTRVPLQTLM